MPAAPALRHLVNHYWLSRDNRDETVSVSPDGSVDIVLAVTDSDCQDFVYGTTTARVDIPIRRGSHYLGISFRPGQCRHFLNASARELTDTDEPGRGLLRFDLRKLAGHVQTGDAFCALDTLLSQFDASRHPERSAIDHAILEIESTRGQVTVTRAAASFGRSVRQFERIFQETVGIPAKLFSRVVRFRHACTFVTHTNKPLSDIAADCGYADQSHMNHEFRRFIGLSPVAYARRNVVFLQDRASTETDNIAS